MLFVIGKSGSPPNQGNQGKSRNFIFDQGVSREKRGFSKNQGNQESCFHFSQEKYHVSADPITLTRFTTPSSTDHHFI